ncbi:hypothetical protein [Paenibacillus radicis (ex Xue et al. 2023)]|uniref:Uncharacterized protein n=1 Tax=Paenibacillus radicis (ex Xue et al. 2023) TaxID=2972489 RepID=A0ABT1YH42_9BACL|nr:hypothetical protein [Paenibacillus radicis (ex Xue et al. 2023)]MCR8631724.1 hypothetical protein [Paenibacillus radicis (ex Xue et al. 2023)]
MNEHALERLVQAKSEQELAELQVSIQNGGYSAFHQLLEGFKLQIKEMNETQVQNVLEWLQTAERLFPDPGLFSPSWLHIWKELSEMVSIKTQLMEAVPVEERNGEWQVILDNPHTIQEVVCHPSLTFDHAAYLFSYFRPGLEKNEYIRLQKIQNMFIEVGS